MVRGWIAEAGKAYHVWSSLAPPTGPIDLETAPVTWAPEPFFLLANITGELLTNSDFNEKGCF